MNISNCRLCRNSLLEQTYRKLRFLKQREFSLYSDSIGHYAIHVIVPFLNAEYKFIPLFNTLQVISTECSSDVTAYADYDFKLFIKVMKKILRRKNFNLNSYENMWCKYEKII